MDIKVGLAECGDYGKKTVDYALDSLEGALELWNGALPNSEKVLIKPNLLSAKPPEKAITTHPVLVEAMATRLKARGYQVFIGDSPGGAIKGVERYWQKSGLKEAARNAGAGLINFESSGSMQVMRNGRSYPIANPILEFSFILNMPKLKTHVFAGLTGAVKNLFGSIPGLTKAFMHQKAPKQADFAQRLLDIYEISAPTFHIADAVTVIDTKGPSSGRIRPMGSIIAGADGFAVDAVFAKLAGCPVERYITGAEARRRGYPGWDIKKIDVLVRTVKSLTPKDFKVPNIAPFRFIPGFLGSLSERLIRAWPVSMDTCTGCGFCKDSCPVDAIEIEHKKAVMNKEICILCLCCHELCPEGAVDLKRSFLARRLFH